MHIPQTFRNPRRITGGDTKIEEYNTCVIIHRLSATKPFRNNQETNNPRRNCQVRHIGCICILLDAPSERPNPRVFRSKFLTITATTKGLQKVGTNNETSESYTSKSSPPHIQAKKTHLNTAIGQLIAGAFFFGMRSCKYSTTLKG